MSFQEKLELEQQEQELRKAFVANPLPEFEPFVVKKSDKPIVLPEDIVLSTDVRAQERKQFDDMLKQKMEEEEAAKENLKRLQMVRLPLMIVFLFLKAKKYSPTGEGKRQGADQENSTTSCSSSSTRKTFQ